jgi:hypothetical protein
MRVLRQRLRSQSGQATVEYALTYVGIILPLTFAIIFTAQLLWIWHSVVDFTRDGARYAATHCWQASQDNVVGYMRTHVPAMIDQDQFQNGTAEISVRYFTRDPASGVLSDFSCDGECSTSCIPDTVTVSINNYEFRKFLSVLGIPPVPLPDFHTSLPMEGAGCDPEQGSCLP